MNQLWYNIIVYVPEHDVFTDPEHITILFVLHFHQRCHLDQMSMPQLHKGEYCIANGKSNRNTP